MEFSIILPIYNVAPYIERCLDSIFLQKLPVDEYEVIAVDDGSTDETPQILEYYRSQHSNLTIRRIENSGPSVARNTGLEMARGRYIYFVDPDDYLATESLPRLLVELAGHNRDIVGIRYCNIDENNETSEYHHQQYPQGKEMTGADFLRGNLLIGVVWGYLFRREFLLENNLRMIPGIFHQDEEFVTKAFFYARSVIFTDIFTYFYFHREGSTVNKKDRAHRERLIGDRLQVLDSIYALSLTSEEAKDVLRRKLLFLSVDMIIRLIRDSHRRDFVNEILDRLTEMSLYPLPEMEYGIKYKVFRKIVNTRSRVVSLAATPSSAFSVKRLF